jgi:hypothetical protein
MKQIKKILRKLLFVFILLLAGFGVGFYGAVLPEKRERWDKQVTTEQVIKDDEEEEDDEVKE